MPLASITASKQPLKPYLQKPYLKKVIGCGFLGTVCEVSRRPKRLNTVTYKPYPQKPPLYKTFDRITGPEIQG